MDEQAWLNNKANRKGCPRINKGNSSKCDDTTSTYTSVLFCLKKTETQHMPEFTNSLVIKCAIHKMSPLLRQDSSEELPPLDCMCKPSYPHRLTNFDMPSC